MGVTFIAPQGTYTAPAKLVSKSITENGTYDPADDNANGYSSVTVEVGGGSSDFSTAEVTMTTDAELYGAFVSSDGYSLNAVGGDAGVYTIILYKGKAMLNIDGIVQSTSGAIEYDSDYETYYVTGNCTIN